MKLIELFSGIGGFSKGLTDAGYRITEHYFSEIDKHAIANYQYNFPNAKYIGDIKFVQSADFKGIDIITFGSPCQDFSMAGKRKGLAGEKSSLIEEAIRLVTDIRPGVFIWENVKGALSSNSGADFWAIIQAFANIGAYRLEWQLINTKWFLPQNRERIFLVGHLAGRSSGNVFPIEKGSGFRIGPGETEEKIYTDNTTALTQKARQYASWNGDFVAIGAFRGRNPENPKSRKSGLQTRQMHEINRGGVSNTLTSVQKDNVVVGTRRDFKGEIDLRKMKDNRSPSIPARVQEQRAVQPAIPNAAAIRRLTEIECERLQGFPEQKLLICFKKSKRQAIKMERKGRKLQKFVLNIEKTDLNLNDLLSEQTDKHIQKNVHINFAEHEVKIYNHKKMVFAGKNLESKNWFHPVLKVEDFVLLLVRLRLIQEKGIIIGKDGLQAKEQVLIHQKTVRRLERLDGIKTMRNAGDAERDLIILDLLLNYSTSSHLTTKNTDVILRTWYSFVTHVISRFIQGRILLENLSELSLSIDYGWTKFGNYDGAIKEIPKNQRYRMLGNAVTVKVVEEIVKRLEIK